MRFLLVLYIFLSSRTYASYALKESNGDIILKGENCDELRKEAQEIFNWAYKLGEVSNIVDFTCNYKHFLGIKWGYQINITKIVPKLVQKYLGLHPSNNGPNCWNSTLVVNKISPFLRFTSPEEFAFWLDSPLCRQKLPGEKLLSGDIISIKELEKKSLLEHHGFTYISPHLSFTKNGLDKANPYGLMPTDDVFSIYNLEKGCQLPPHKNNCKKMAVAYSCTTFEKYFSEPIDKELQEAFDEVQKTDCAAQQLSMFGDKNKNKSLYNFIDMNVDVLQWMIQDLMKTKNYTPKEKFLLNALFYKINAIKRQLSLLN